VSVFSPRSGSPHLSILTLRVMILFVIVAQERMSYFIAGLTNDNPEITAPVYKQYHHVQYDGILPASATASVSFPPSADTFRYVIIQARYNGYQALCLTEVKVFLRGILAYFVYTNIEVNTIVNSFSMQCFFSPMKNRHKRKIIRP